MTITYQIQIDYDDSGDFTDLHETISADVLSAAWRVGFDAPHEPVAAPSSATITVRNHTRSFSPEVTGNLSGKRLRIRSHDGTTLRTHFTGFITQVTVEGGTRGQRQAQIIAHGRGYELDQHRIRLPLQTDVRADEAIADILAQVNWRYDQLLGRCIIGRDTIGSSWIFPDEAISQSLEAGKSRFAFITDDRGGDLLASDAITHLARGEGGRFFFDREGQAIFHNRHHLLMDNAQVATFQDDMVDLDYAYGAVINDIHVTLTPRTIGNPESTLWTLATPLKVKRGQTMQIVARYAVDGQAVGAIAVQTPEAGTHYAAATAVDASGTDLTAQFQVIRVEAGLDACRLEIRNHAAVDGFLTQLHITGTPLITGNPLLLTQSDPTSIALYGQHHQRYTLPVITDTEEALGFLQWELLRKRHPAGRAQSLMTDTRHHPHEALALSLFDRIKISESQTGHSAAYHIIAEAHQVDLGGTCHHVRWTLEPAESERFFIIGTHTIGDDVLIVPR